VENFFGKANSLTTKWRNFQMKKVRIAGIIRLNLRMHENVER
jgi:hypothetical protein